jgi:hypothetical protein
VPVNTVVGDQLWLARGRVGGELLQHSIPRERRFGLSPSVGGSKKLPEALGIALAGSRNCEELAEEITRMQQLMKIIEATDALQACQVPVVRAHFAVS